MNNDRRVFGGCEASQAWHVSFLFDLAAECWYPVERLVECPECFGCGTVELEEMDDPFNWERAA